MGRKSEELSDHEADMTPVKVRERRKERETVKCLGLNCNSKTVLAIPTQGGVLRLKPLVRGDLCHAGTCLSCSPSTPGHKLVVSSPWKSIVL